MYSIRRHVHRRAGADSDMHEEAVMTTEYIWNAWNVGWHENELVESAYGTKTVYHLDLIWKAKNIVTGQIVTFDSAVGIARWLNEWQYIPTGRKL